MSHNWIWNFLKVGNMLLICVFLKCPATEWIHHQLLEIKEEVECGKQVSNSYLFVVLPLYHGCFCWQLEKSKEQLRNRPKPIFNHLEVQWQWEFP
jgi:hypothetical protein